MVFEQTNAGRAPSLSTRRINGTRRASGALALDQSLTHAAGVRRASSRQLAERCCSSAALRHMRGPASPASSVSQSLPHSLPAYAKNPSLVKVDRAEDLGCVFSPLPVNIRKLLVAPCVWCRM